MNKKNVDKIDLIGILLISTPAIVLALWLLAHEYDVPIPFFDQLNIGNIEKFLIGFFVIIGIFHIRYPKKGRSLELGEGTHWKNKTGSQKKISMLVFVILTMLVLAVAVFIW